MSDISVVEETLKKLTSCKGVQGVVIFNGDGIPIRSTLDNSLSVQYAGLVSRFVTKTRGAVKRLDSAKPDDELLSVRLRSRKHEIIVAPEFLSGHEYTLVVVQKPETD